MSRSQTFGILDIIDMILGCLLATVGVVLYYVFFALTYNSESKYFENWLVPAYIIFLGFLVFIKNFNTAFHFRYFALLHSHLGLCFFFACVSLFQFAYWNQQFYLYDTYPWYSVLQLASACAYAVVAVLRLICRCSCTVQTTQTTYTRRVICT